MNAQIHTLLFLCLVCCGAGLAQNSVRVRVLDENDQPLKSVRLTLSGKSLPVETQSNGEFNLDFTPGQHEMVLYPPKGFVRVSPPNGVLYLPEDKSRTLTVWMAREGRESREVELFTKILSKKEQEKTGLQTEHDTLKARLDRLVSERQTTSALYDSLNTLLRQNNGNAAALEREMAELRQAVELKQQLYYQNISGELVVYTDRLKDLRDALPRVSDAFIDARSMAHLENTIAQYNAARDSLLYHSKGHVEVVRALWDDTAARELASVYENIRVAVHEEVVLPLNTQLLAQFRAVNAEEVRPAQARKHAQAAANETFAKLNALIPFLETDIRALCSSLESSMH